MKTNLILFLNATEKANQEPMTIFTHGAEETNQLIVAHNDKAYIIDLNNEGEVTSCSCPSFQHRNIPCKHMIKVSLEKSLNLEKLT